MQSLLQCILKKPLLYRVYDLLAISTGLRRGELCALRWTDLKAGQMLQVSRSRGAVVGKGMVESDTKNHRTRLVAIPDMVDEYLCELFYTMAVENGGVDVFGLIFQKNGKPIDAGTFSRRLRRLYDRNGFPREYHLHTLRHYFATYLLENNTSKQVTAALLGHADTAFLERTYCHPQDICKMQAASILNDLLEPAEQEARERKMKDDKQAS